MILVVAASVFLCLAASCGIPTYLTEVNAKITSNADPSFSIHYDSESVSKDTDRVGLLLLYYVEDSSANSAKNLVNTQFNTKYRPTQYDGITVNVEADTPVLSFKSSDSNYEFYAFETGSGVVQAPLYTYQIDDNPANYSVSFEYEASTKNIEMKVKNSLLVDIETVTLSLHDDFEPTLDNNYIHIFGAVSVQGKSYSNIYWSDLQYCASLQVYE